MKTDFKVIYSKLDAGDKLDLTGDVYLVPYTKHIISLSWDEKVKFLRIIKERVKELTQSSIDKKYKLKLCKNKGLKGLLRFRPQTVQSQLSYTKAALRTLYFIQRAIKTGVVGDPHTKTGKIYLVTLLTTEYYGVIQKSQQPNQFRIESKPLHTISKDKEIYGFLGFENDNSSKYASSLNAKLSLTYGEFYQRNPRFLEITNEINRLTLERNEIINKSHLYVIDYIKNKLV